MKKCRLYGSVYSTLFGWFFQTTYHKTTFYDYILFAIINMSLGDFNYLQLNRIPSYKYVRYTYVYNMYNIRLTMIIFFENREWV